MESVAMVLGYISQDDAVMADILGVKNIDDKDVDD